MYMIEYMDASKIDKHVCKRLCLRRSLLGLNPKTLGENVGLSYQKIYSHEQNESPITAGWLFEFSRVLDVPITYFYEGLYKNVSLEIALNDLSELPIAFFKENFFIQPENFELLVNYQRIQDKALQSDIFKLLKTAGRIKQ